MNTQRAPRGPSPGAAPSDQRLIMSHDGGQLLTTADTITELLDGLIEDYSSLDNAAATQARIRHAIDIQVALQARLVATTSEPVTDAERQVLLGVRHEQPVIDTWDAKVPLVVVTSFYEPHTEVPRPSGNVIWLDPTDETTFVTSLAAAGVIHVVVNDDTRPRNLDDDR